MQTTNEAAIRIIDSEEPKIHWGFLDVKDKFVLDLGCGAFLSEQSTTEWFKEQGATRIVGVDMGKNIRGDFEFMQMSIQSREQLDELLLLSPDVIKCDIEGAEIFWKDIKDLGNCTLFAVEYHSTELKILMEKKMIEWGFSLNYCQLFDIDINWMGVIYGTKEVSILKDSDKFSVVIPTLWQSTRIHRLLDDLSDCDKVGEIIIIDNNSEYYNKVSKCYPKVHLLQQSENIFVNPAWNLGVKTAKYEQICIANDDINFDTNIFDYLDGKIEGVIGMDTNNYELQESGNFIITKIQTRCWAWGCLIFINKKDWIDIPDSLLIWYGDDYLINRLPAFIIGNLWIESELSTTSGSVKFSPIYENDLKNYKKLQIEWSNSTQSTF